MKDLKKLWMSLTHRPSANMLAHKELENARRSLLENQTNAEYYAALCDFDMARICRLREYIKQQDL